MDESSLQRERRIRRSKLLEKQQPSEQEKKQQPEKQPKRKPKTSNLAIPDVVYLGSLGSGWEGGSEMIVRITRTVTAIEYISDDPNPPVYCGIWDEVTGLTNREIEEEIKSISVCMWFSKGEPERN